MPPKTKINRCGISHSLETYLMFFTGKGMKLCLKKYQRTSKDLRVIPFVTRFIILKFVLYFQGFTRHLQHWTKIKKTTDGTPTSISKPPCSRLVYPRGHKTTTRFNYYTLFGGTTLSNLWSPVKWKPQWIKVVIAATFTRHPYFFSFLEMNEFNIY